METVNWKVEGMSCANCALTIGKFLEKEGLKNVRVSYASGDVSFEENENVDDEHLRSGISALGYQVLNGNASAADASAPMNKYLRYLIICAPFTLVLMLHMFDSWQPLHWLMNPWIQLVICIPVYITGMNFFGRSAVMSIRNGIPNMNVLVALGATAAFVYSLAGTVFHLGHEYLFYETAAAIITLIFLGNYVEDLSKNSTQRALNSLVRTQKVMANMIAFNEQHEEVILPVENTHLHPGDLLLIRTGEQVPADCKILWGNASVNESILTGESLPQEKNPKDFLMGGSLLTEGTVKVQVTAAPGNSVLANIINLVKQAQGEKPPMQQLADRISAIFVPVVIVLSAFTFLLNSIAGAGLTPSLMRSIAVLVIACPCAMGLATPAAIAVGLGRAAKNGILFRKAKSLELFKNITQVVFDKTGTLTTGNFRIRNYFVDESLVSDASFRSILYSLEKFSNHPIAKSISAEWKTKEILKWSKVEEMKGVGMLAVSPEGDRYKAGSYRISDKVMQGDIHHVYLSKNDQMLGWVDITDELRPEAVAVVGWLKKQKIKTILLSGDRKEKCVEIAKEAGIDEVFADQSPQQKLEKIEELTRQHPTVMVGDGINDAPALAKATIGISLSDASQLAIQTADVVLMNRGLHQLPLAIGLGKNTYQTIRQNLFWAFFYNILAIPVAALGLLTPGIAALAMGLSDVILAANSVRLYVKKVM